METTHESRDYLVKIQFSAGQRRHNIVAFSVISSFAFSILGGGFSVGKCFQFYSGVVGKYFSL